MQKYPLALNIRDTKTADMETVQAVRSWLQGNGCRIARKEEILKKFENCTPAYIAKAIVSNLQRKEM
jgi:hypothetical protein